MLHTKYSWLSLLCTRNLKHNMWRACFPNQGYTKSLLDKFGPPGTISRSHCNAVIYLQHLPFRHLAPVLSKWMFVKYIDFFIPFNLPCLMPHERFTHVYTGIAALTQFVPEPRNNTLYQGISNWKKWSLIFFDQFHGCHLGCQNSGHFTHFDIC